MRKVLLPFLILLLVLVGIQFIPLGSVDDHPEIDVYLISNEIHIGIVLPRKNDVFDWDAYLPIEAFTHATSDWLAFGWGDRRFYFEMPTWEHFTMELAIDALFFPSEAVLHVDFLSYSPLATEAHVRKIRVSKKTYAQMVRLIQSWFLEVNGRPVLIPGKGYTERDNFFTAKGSYSLIKTCNSWTAEILGGVGLKRPLWSPTKYGLELIYQDQ